MCGRGLPNLESPVRRLISERPNTGWSFENTERMLITRAVTVRRVLFLRPPDTITLSSSTVFDVVAEAREP